MFCLGGETIFEDCIQEGEENSSICENLSWIEPSVSKRKPEATPLSAVNNGKTLTEDELSDAVQAHPEPSFMEFSRKVMDSISGVYESQKESTSKLAASKATEDVVKSQDDSKDALEILTDLESSYVLAELTSNAEGTLLREEVLDNGEKVANEPPPVKSSSRRRRKRARHSSSVSQQSGGDGIQNDGAEVRSCR